MINTILYALVVGGLTSIHGPALKTGDTPELTAARKLWATKFAFSTFLAALCHYIVGGFSQAALPTLTFDLIWALLILNFFTKGGDRPLNIAVVLSIVMLFTSCVSLTVDTSETKIARIGLVERVDWGKTPPPLELANIPLVSGEQAIAQGSKVVKESLGDRYALGSFTLQKVDGVPVWVAPLEFRSFSGWFFGDYAPGAVVVNANEATVSARVVSVDKKNTPVRLVFTPGAFFQRQLNRHVNAQGLFNFLYEEAHLELDDDMKPWWVVFGYSPLSNKQVKSGKILLVDPETGATHAFTPDTIPSWVDVVVSRLDIATKIKDWGTLSGGKGAALAGSPFLVTPSIVNGQSVFFVNGSDGRSYYYAGMKQANIRYDRLESFTLTDIRSGKTIEYPYVGTLGKTPALALEKVSKQLSSSRSVTPTAPVLCSIDRRPVYVVSIIDEQGALTKVALIDVQRDIIALGNDKELALKEFKKLVESPESVTN